MSTTHTAENPNETTTVKIDKETRDRFRAFADSIDGTYDDALRELLEIAAEAGHWDSEEGSASVATAEDVEELEQTVEQLYAAMKQNREAIEALQDAE